MSEPRTCEPRRASRAVATVLLAMGTACAPSTREAGDAGLLLGYFDGTRYRTMWLVVSDTSAIVAAEVPELIVPRAGGFWRVGVTTLCHDDGTRQVIYQSPVAEAPLVPGTPCPDSAAAVTTPDPDSLDVSADTAPVFRTPENCDASEAEILFVSPTHIAERAHLRQTEECEPRGGRYRDVNRVRALDSPTPIDLRAVFGDEARAAYEAAVRRGYAIVSREMNCPEPDLEEPDLASWGIERQRGAWHAVGMDNRWALCELADTLGLPLPDSITGEGPTRLTWDAVAAGVPGLLDYFAAPGGSVVVATSGRHGTAELLSVHTVKGGRPDRKLLEIPSPTYRSPVMMRWAEGGAVAEWSRELSRIAERPLPAPRDSTRRGQASAAASRP